MAEHDEHSSFIKTPQQLVTVVLLAFVVPIFGIVMLVHLVTGGPHAEPEALTPEAVAARLQPLGRVVFAGSPEAAAEGAVASAAAPAASAAPKTGEEIVQAVCSACHLTGAAGAPKIGDNAAWGPRMKVGLKDMLEFAIKGKNAMPPRGGTNLSDLELERAIVYMADKSGGSFKEPEAPKAAAADEGRAKGKGKK
ncbi:MAG TPA: c-type cytochrome [Burkholderiales bacterium]|nr:c-type cytochrome [Burkholderiales bacterium]